MEIDDGVYQVTYDPATATVAFRGRLRLLEYDRVEEALEEMAAGVPGVISLDLRALECLNSAGIGMLFRFIIRVRNEASTLVVRGSADVPWQPRLLQNLKRLLPELQVELG